MPLLVLGAGTLSLALVQSSAQAATTVNLGTAGSYAILAGSGITNTGVTTVTGDIGTSPTPAETGLAPCPTAADCVVLTGSNHPADAAALKAKQDLTTAYDAAAGQPKDATITADLGGQTFTPGVYQSATSIGLTGEVTLDAQNVAGSVFIFQAGSSLVTAGASSVKLINGASACNVFWQVGSAATLGTTSTFRGTILAHDDISLGDSVTVDGRLLGGEQASGTGAVTLIHDTIGLPNCAALVVAPSAPAPVPVAVPIPSPSASVTPTPTATPTATASATSTPSATATPVPTPSLPTPTVAPVVRPVDRTTGASTPGTTTTTTTIPGTTTPGTTTTVPDTTIAGGPQVTRVPTGGVQAGGGSTTGLQHRRLIDLGGGLLLTAAFVAVRRRWDQAE